MYVLLLVILTNSVNSSPGPIIAEYNSEKACVTAAQNLAQKIAIKSDRPVVYTCDPKG